MFDSRNELEIDFIRYHQSDKYDKFCLNIQKILFD